MNSEILEEVLDVKEVLRKVPGVWKRVMEVEEDPKVHEGVPGVLGSLGGPEEVQEVLRKSPEVFQMWRSLTSSTERESRSLS